MTATTVSTFLCLLIVLHIVKWPVGLHNAEYVANFVNVNTSL